MNWRNILALPALWAELISARQIIRELCTEWAEDHTYLQKLCRDIGCTEAEVTGDKYGIPGIQDLADQLKRRIHMTETNNSQAAESNSADHETEAEWYRYVPEPQAHVAFAARLIFGASHPRSIEFVPNRMAYRTCNKPGAAMWKARLREWMSKEALPALRLWLEAENIKCTDCREFELRTDVFYFTANPRASAGYLYIEAYNTLPPFAKFNNGPHKHIDIPDGVSTLSCRTSDGRRITFAFLPYRNNGTPQCVDIKYHDSALPKVQNAECEVAQMHAIAFSKGATVFDTRSSKTTPTTLITVLMHD